MRTKPKPRGRPADQARREMIVRLRESGMTFDKIGKNLHPQVSRQCAQATYKRALENVDKKVTKA